MASERQIAANRRNAGKSTGPRSRGAKRRTSMNAYRHGLAASCKTSLVIEKQLDALARQIAGDSTSDIVLALARSAAQAVFDLAHIRGVKLALIEQVSALGGIPQTYDPFFESVRDINTRFQLEQAELSKEDRQLIKGYLRLFKASLGRKARTLSDPIDPPDTMPSEGTERTAEAVRRALPELVKLNRYEARAVSRRDQAIRRMVKIRSREDWRN
jgi:hypothetical protein